jgi:anaerobic magnesium-protoporphyrin IX monomethyl ester cyclase
MANVLLLYPCYTYPRKNPPIGLAYIAAALQKNGHEVEILDLNVTSLSKGELRDLASSRSYAVFGISFMTNQFGEASRLARLLKSAAPHTPIIVGGPHASAIPERTLVELPHVNAVCVGEGEETMCEYVEAVLNRKYLSKVAGLVFRNGSRIIVKSPPRPLISDVDRIPFPAWELLKLSSYSVYAPLKGQQEQTFALLSSRGCPNHCIFCDSHAVFGRKFRARSAENIFDEISMLHDVYGMTQFDFVDDLITVDKERILRLCNLLRNAGTKFRWMANARVNTVDREMLRAMRDAGCVRIDLGVESGDPEVRRQCKKRISDQQIINAHRDAHALGISTNTFLMVGNLGESPGSVRITAKLMKKLAQDTSIAIACPYPGTELYRIGMRNHWIRTHDWNQYVTSPTYFPGYRPVMVTDRMSEKVILDAYYYLHSFFAKRKFQARYGRLFFLNRHFITNWLFKSSPQGGFLRKLKMFLNLARCRLLHARHWG